MTKTSRITAWLGVLLLGLFAGCTTVQLSDNGQVLGEYRLGYLITQSHEGFTDAYVAAKDAFKEMGFLTVHDERGAAEAVLRARDAQDNLIEVKLKELSPGYTNVKIRYGLAGNLAMSQQLYQLMRKHF
jgi:hypothetical protein